MDNFDLRKYLVENKVTRNSKMLSEGYQGTFYAPEYLEQKYGKEIASKIETEIDELDANSWDRFTAMESAEEVEDYIVDIKDMLGLTEMKKKHSKMMKEQEGSPYTVIASYMSRNDEGDYDYSYLKATNTQDALIQYLTKEQNYTPQDASSFVKEMEKTQENGVDVWSSDDPYYMVAKGQLDTDTMQDLVLGVN